MSAPDVERLVKERTPSERDRAIWRTALTLAHNMCVQDSNRINDDDGSLEVVHALCDEAKRIRGWMEPTDAQLTEMFSEADVPHLSSRPDSIPPQDDVVKTAEESLKKLERMCSKYGNGGPYWEIINAFKPLVEAYRAKQYSLPSMQDDVAGRLAEALEDMLDLAVVSPGSTRKIQHADKVLKAYRANPSGWIPVGERLPEELKADIQFEDGRILKEAVFRQSAWWWFGVVIHDRVTLMRPLSPPPQEGRL